MKIYQSHDETSDEEIVGEGLQATKVIIPNSVKKIKERVQVLLASKSHGQKNVLQELTALLDVLLERKQITKQNYLNYLNKK